MKISILSAAIAACVLATPILAAQELPAPAAPSVRGTDGPQGGAGVTGSPQGDPRAMAGAQAYPGSAGGYQQGHPGMMGGYQQGYPGTMGGYQQGYPGMMGGYQQGYPGMMGGSQGWPGMGGSQGWWPDMMGGSSGWPGMMGGRQW